jgi:hypothetical protein
MMHTVIEKFYILYELRVKELLQFRVICLSKLLFRILYGPSRLANMFLQPRLWMSRYCYEKYSASKVPWIIIKPEITTPLAVPKSSHCRIIIFQHSLQNIDA